MLRVFLSARRFEGLFDGDHAGGEAHSLLLRAACVGEDSRENGADGAPDHRNQKGENNDWPFILMQMFQFVSIIEFDLFSM